jgi:hypothetical protein
MESTPDPSEAGNASGTDSVNTAKADESFLHHADEVYGAKAAAPRVLQAAQIEDGVADELSGAVVGDVAAAIDLVKGDAAAGKQFVRGENVGAASIATKREHRGMFEQEKDVSNVAIETKSCNLSLQAKCFVIGNAAEIEILDHRTSYSRERGRF